MYVNKTGYGDTKRWPMRQLVNINHILEQLRQKALAGKESGPRVFVIGNPQTGKGAITKILVNYSLKLGWTPLMADIDLSQNMISSPGCISATLVDSVLDGVTDNLASRSINYFHGACNPGSFIITPDLFDT